MSAAYNSVDDQGRPLCEKCGGVTDGKLFDQSFRQHPDNSSAILHEKFAFCDRACQRAFFGYLPI